MPHLQNQLDQITQNTRTLVQPERLEVNERAIAELFATGIEQNILPAGELAPEFTLPDASGRPVKCADLLALGPLIINFFRGRWCPYCMTELEAWRDLYPAIRERGALVIGISPQLERQNDFTASQHAVPFPLLTDRECAVANKFGLVWTVPPSLQNYYRSILVNIPFMNGEDSWKLPLPATYVLAQSGEILYAEGYSDFRVRPDPEEALRALPAFARPKE
jgi:peroxiredoxin